MRKSSAILVSGVLAVALAGCGAASTPAPTVAPTNAPAASPATSAAASPSAVNPADIKIPKPSGTLAFKISHPTAAFSFNSLTRLITDDRLRADGWTITDEMLTNGELAVAAVADGSADIGEGVISQALTAAQTGKSLKWISSQNPNEFVIISRADITKCSDLNGKVFAINSAGSQYTVMSNQYMASCGAKPASTLTISGGDLRIAGMQQGQIDAAYVQIPDWINLNAQAPGKFRVLVNFAETNKGISGAAIYANGNWLAKNRAVAVAYVAEFLKTNRMTDQNPDLITQAAAKYLQGSKNIPETIQAYRGLGWWPLNGDMTQDGVANAIKFYEDTNVMPKGLTVAQAADFTVLQDALKILGTVPNRP